MAGRSDGAIEVLIPHWNRAEQLRATLESLERQTAPAPIRVVDNASTDSTTELLREEFPAVKHQLLDRNYGFGAALNRGVEASEADLLVFLNNDVVADEDFLRQITLVAEADGAEMVAACLRQPDGSIDSLGVAIDRSLIAYDVGRDLPYSSARDLALSPLAPTGGAAAFRREAFEQVGGFDERFFAYLEDVELGIRMRMAGMRCATAYAAFGWHRHSGTLGGGSASKNRQLGRSRGYLLWKYGRSMSMTDRLRGGLVDAIIYTGELVLDRNIGGVRGRIEARTSRPGAAPVPDPGIARVPRVPISLAGSLRSRLARRISLPVRA